MTQSSNRPQVPDSERSGFPVRPIILVAIGVCVIAVLIFVGNAVLFRYLAGDIAPVAESRAERPPEPLLQINPSTDLQRFRAHEEELLDTYGWIDRDKRVVRIPIDRAMELMAQRANAK